MTKTFNIGEKVKIRDLKRIKSSLRGKSFVIESFSNNPFLCLGKVSGTEKILAFYPYELETLYEHNVKVDLI